MTTMTLSDGVAYVERPKQPGFMNGCKGCDFANCFKAFSKSKRDLCLESFTASLKAFSGDCITRNVIYIKADPQPAKE